MAMLKECTSQVRVSAGFVAAVLLVMVMMEPAASAVVLHQVGGSGVWTIAPKVSYGRWAASKVFRVNDILSFNYPIGIHDVLMVSKLEYLQCKVRKPMASYRNGKTRVKLGKKGTYFFICGIPGHCQAGMKMAITVR